MHLSSSSQSPYPDHVIPLNHLPGFIFPTLLLYVFYVMYKRPSHPTHRIVLTLLTHLSLICSLCPHTISLPLQRAKAFLLYLLQKRVARAVWIRPWGISSIAMLCRINTQIQLGFLGVQHQVMNLLYLLYLTSLPLPLATAPTSTFPP